MEERPRCGELGEVPVVASDEVPVVDVEERGDRIASDLSEGVGSAEQPGEERDCGQDCKQGREEPPDPMPPEAQQRDAAVLTELGDQEAGDQEAREDEEDVHAQEAAGCPGQPAVEAEHQDDPERPDAVEGWDADDALLGILAR